MPALVVLYQLNIPKLPHRVVRVAPWIDQMDIVVATLQHLQMLSQADGKNSQARSLAKLHSATQQMSVSTERALEADHPPYSARPPRAKM